MHYSLILIIVGLIFFAFVLYFKRGLFQRKMSEPTDGGHQTIVQPPVPTWEDLGIGQESVALLKAGGFLKPTQVQVEAIPAFLNGQDLIVSAETGSGKTASFVLPLIEKIRGRKGTLGIIVCPTREIALQIHQVLLQLAEPQGVKSICLIGGVNIRGEEAALKEYPQIIVGTPGRICDHQERGHIWFEYIDYIVLDEADLMLDMGFSAQINGIMKEMTDNRQTMLFSATIAGETEKLAKKYIRNPKTINIGARMTIAETIEQRLLWVNENSKMRELLKIFSTEKGSILVFLRTKNETSKLWRQIHSRGFYESGYLSSDKLQKHREQTLAEFREGKIRILIATDVAGRGIHVDDVAHVINFDLPQTPEDYIHRVGRTGRKGKKGISTTFVSSQDRELLAEIEKTLGIQIPERITHDFAEHRPVSRKNDRDLGKPRGHTPNHKKRR